MADYAKYLLWIDLETTGLPKGNDYSGIHILEVGAILTDLNLNKMDGYTEVIGMTQEAAEAIRSNDIVREMHKTSGLLVESVESQFTLDEAEASLVDMLTEHGIKKGEVAIAGSGVTAYDFPIIKEKMPLLANMLTYYSYDIGIFRRMFKAVAPRDVVDPGKHRYGDAKVHRAMSDIEDHLGEAKDYQTALGEIIAPF